MRANKWLPNRSNRSSSIREEKNLSIPQNSIRGRSILRTYPRPVSQSVIWWQQQIRKDISLANTMYGEYNIPTILVLRMAHNNTGRFIQATILMIVIGERWRWMSFSARDLLSVPTSLTCSQHRVPLPSGQQTTTSNQHGEKYRVTSTTAPAMNW